VQLDSPRRFAAGIHLVILCLATISACNGLVVLITLLASNRATFDVSLIVVLSPFLKAGFVYLNYIARKDLLENHRGNRMISLIVGAVLLFVDSLFGSLLGVMLLASVFYSWKAEGVKTKSNSVSDGETSDV